METKFNQITAMRKAKQVILDVCAEFEKISGRKYGLFEEYKMEDAEYAIVIMGSAAGTTKDCVDELRAKGVKAGMIKIRVLRPFPGEELAEALKNCKAVAVMDRAENYSTMSGPVGSELKAAMYDAGLNVPTLNYYYGIGGRDYTVESAEGVYNDLQALASGSGTPEQFQYIGLRK